MYYKGEPLKIDIFRGSVQHRTYLYDAERWVLSWTKLVIALNNRHP
ncbi:conserved hypothetical protein [Treponema phagedenis]|uniref:Uncharacterized protein n=1 Tax=Treponema phagedenis TaxID=162 RepID=A0A0B7GZQ1_TREPH|nr:conserved hypothetical protein [Treponema phagedenis]